MNNSMERIGLKVKHSVFGTGVITKTEGNYIAVEFAAKTTKFVYPDAFEKFIKAEDPAVQTVAAVADEEQLAKTIKESACVIDQKSLRTWDSEDVLAVYDSLVRAHESINKLALVPESF